MSKLPPEIVLASASPRRHELLTGMGVAFEVITAHQSEYDATSAPELDPVELARENALYKADEVAATHPGTGRWVLGADTVVALNENVLGKPASLDQAKFFLMELSGQTHEVITACALIAPNGHVDVIHDVSLVTFLVLDGAMIDRYLAEVNVLDKAGAYALQDKGDWIVESVEGSRHNVIGLPTERLERLFKKRGLL